MTDRRCPRVEELVDFLADRLDDKRHQMIESHAEDCPACLEALARLVSASSVDVTESPVRAAGRSKWRTPVAERLVDRLSAEMPGGPHFPHMADVTRSGGHDSPPKVPRQFAGTTFGDYEMLEEIARGGMGSSTRHASGA